MSERPAPAGAPRGRRLAALMDFIRFPSVSSQSAHAADVRACAAWLARRLRAIGMPCVEVVATPGHPIVFARGPRVPGRPTLLIYGHYDVQPADPLPAWESPPFAPAVRGPYLYGRGACDDKGQLFAHLEALAACLGAEGGGNGKGAGGGRGPRGVRGAGAGAGDGGGGLPLNVKCLFEGEEEIGSPHLRAFLERHARALAADAAVMSDTRMLGRDRPAITYALRGGLSMELEVLGPPHDLHSGNFGGAVYNPLQALCEIVAGLTDGRGKVAVPGFYDRVRGWGAGERRRMAADGPSDASILGDAGVACGSAEPGYSLYEALTLRPALTVNGLAGGYQGEGGKAVIPSRAVAKLSFRLVPDQDPADVERRVRRHVARLTPAAVRARVTSQLRARPAVLDRGHPVMRAAAAAYRRGFGVAPVFLRSGGSIPVVAMLQDVLGIPTALLGFALPDDRIHAPNERFYLPNFPRAVATCGAFYRQLAGAPR